LSYGTVSLSLLFTVQRATSSFATAGGTLATFGAASLTTPIKSRLIDRYGQPLTLTLLGASYATLLAGICVLAVLDVDEATVYFTLGGAAGVTAPPLGPSMRALWAALTTSPELRLRAYSLDSVVEESLQTLGPVVTALLIALASPVFALALTASLVLVGSVGLSTSPAARLHAAPLTTRVSEPLFGPLRHPGFLAVLVSILTIGLSLGAVDIGVAARAQHEGAVSAAGYVLAALSLGSTVGGLAWGHRSHRRRRSTQLVALLSMLAFGIAAAAWTPGLIVFGVVLAMTGLAVLVATVDCGACVAQPLHTAASDRPPDADLSTIRSPARSSARTTGLSSTNTPFHRAARLRDPSGCRAQWRRGGSVIEGQTPKGGH
jgi:MFS family permease